MVGKHFSRFSGFGQTEKPLKQLWLTRPNHTGLKPNGITVLKSNVILKTQMSF
jgi:hypothetical protein